MKLLILSSLLLAGCASTGIPPQDVTTGAVSGDVVTKSVNETVNYGMSLYELGALILLAGWAIPSPLEMFGGVGKFILKLLGR